LTPRFLLAALAAVLPVAAMSQGTAPPIETVTVKASALVGVWIIDWPQWGRITFGGTSWGPMENRYCRIEQVKGDLAVHCFGGDMGANSFGSGTANLEGTQIHFAWGNMLLRPVMDGTLQSPTRIAGKMGVKFSGIEHENPQPSNATKYAFPERAGDIGEKAALLRTTLQQLAQGSSTPINDAASKKSLGTLPSDLHALGAIQVVAFLGPSSKEITSITPGVPRVDRNFFSVYAVEFEGGERICGLHQRDDGVVDAFRCV